jgi:hypothetical protein
MSVDSTASGDGEYTLVDVGGYRLAIHCIGEGSPTVVLETGLGAPSEYWAPIQQEIAGLTRVCRFDRSLISGRWLAKVPCSILTRWRL